MNLKLHQGDEVPPPEPGTTLGNADAQALDALIDAGLDPAAVDPALRDRATKVASVLGLLNADHISCERALVDVTIQRLVRHAEPVLSSDDAEALDAWSLADYRADQAPATLRERARRHEKLAEVVRDSEITATPLLVERTFQAIAARVASDRAQGLQMRPQRSWRLADAISVAAMLLIGASVLWPSMGYLGRKGREWSCNSNLGSVASAMGLYAGDHRDSLPIATAGFGGGIPWWNVSPNKPQSNSANLYTLARTKYSRLNELACAGNPGAERGDCKPGTFDWPKLEAISYSYQIMAGPVRPNYHRTACEPATTVILADKSPVVQRALSGLPIDPLENSPNHEGIGQFVLYADGSVHWMTSPERPSGDNIWLPRSLEELIRQAAKFHQTGRLEGFEIPSSDTDSFVGP
ncbi:MAG: hypothetical protein U0573_11200 [Phycisphaerales bacterium]|nr:hypothetical protein [Planctomycetota bacterium]